MAAVELNTLKAGADEGTPVVLVHGYTGDMQSWRLTAPILGEKRPVYSIDLPCHGLSPIQIPESFDDFVGAAAGHIESLDLGPFHLVGHSLGGAVAFALSEKLRGKIKSLCAVAPAGLAPEVYGAFISEYVLATEPDEIQKWLQRVVGEKFVLPDGMAELMAAKRTDPDRIAAQSAIGRMFFPEGTQAIDVNRQVGEIDIPCKIIWGKQDTLIPWHHCLKAPAHVGLHLMPEVGHMPPLEAPDLLAAIIEELIASAGG